MWLFKKKKPIEPEEYARVIDWEPEWDMGAPIPQVLSKGHKTYLIYYIDEPDPEWDGTYTTMIDHTSDHTYPLALVEFNICQSYKFGIVNDEASHGHPLADKGLGVYQANIIENSKWIKEIKNIHKVHPRFDEKHWARYKHYLLFFKDDIFEIIADGYSIEVHNTTFLDLSLEVAKRLNS